MKYFAELDQNNTVLRIIVIDSAEEAKAMFGGNWVETFMNRPDKNYAGFGDIYVPTLENFMHPRKYENTILDTKTLRWRIATENRESSELPDFIQEPTTIITRTGKVFVWDKTDRKWNDA